jgi:Zn-dependent protease
MRPAFKLGGVSVFIHWTFWVLVAFYLFSASSQAGLAAGIYAAAFVLSVFGCVLLHEFGHSAAARYYGIRTLDITLYPFGGVARLENVPQKPVQELIIALAGPAVNVVIAAILFGVLVMVGVHSLTFGELAQVSAIDTSFVDRLLLINIILVVFNMLPAFPMDGGRVLRSLLAMRTGHLRATEIAARVGRWMALAFCILAIVYGPFMLIVVAGFVYIAGTAELMQVRLRSLTGANGGEPAAQLHRYPGDVRQFTWRSGSTFNEADGQDWSTHRSSATRTSSSDVIDAIEVRKINEQ